MTFEQLLKKLSGPERSALTFANIVSFEVLAQYSEKEIAALDGMNPKSIPLLSDALEKVGLAFRKD